MIEYPDMTGYFRQVIIPRRGSCTGYYNYYGVYQTSCTCWTYGGCTYYELINNEPYDPNQTYYELTGGHMQQVDPSTLPPPVQHTGYMNGFNANYNMSTYYKLINIPRYSSINGYYDQYGNMVSGTCNTQAGCNYYQLLNYYDNLGDPNLIDINETYYYLATRDTNIIVMDSSISGTWGSSQNKPLL